MGTKTGLPGFVIDGKVHDLFVGDPSNTSPLRENPPEDDGDIDVDHSLRDIDKTTKTTLAKYLSDVTLGKSGDGSKGVANEYPIDPPSDPVAEITLSDAGGVPRELSETTNSSRFAPRDDVTRHSDDFKEIEHALKKGKSRTPGPDGNELLQSIRPKLEDPDVLPEPIKKFKSAVLGRNRFTASSRAFDVDRENYKTIGALGQKLETLQAGQDLSGFKPLSPTTSLNHMAKVGPMLSLRASRELRAWGSSINDKIDPSDAGSVAAALVPSPGQLGVLKVDIGELEARSALESIINDAEVGADEQIEHSPIGGQSWGSLNNVEEPFDGLLNIGMVAMSLALQAALLIVFEGIGFLVSLGGESGEAARDDRGKYTLGSYLKKPRASGLEAINIHRLLGLRGTVFPFGSALKVGVTAFFLGAQVAKEEGAGGIGGQVVAGLSQALTNTVLDGSTAGFNVVVARAIVRSGQVIAADADKIGKAFASNPISGIKSVNAMLANLRRSKIIAAMNVFTTLGDAILKEQEEDIVPAGEFDVLDRTSTLNAYPDDGVDATVKKSRLKDSLKLAWASNRAPSLHLLSDPIRTFRAVSGLPGTALDELGKSDAKSKSGFLEGIKTKSRLDPDAVAEFESKMDAEYVPFSFQDLRTNEIVSFHAFLTSLTDDYSVNWESSEGFGRVDPVRSYKNVSRKIGLSFYVVSTSQPDFDEMWEKINWLTMLLYPQYSKGRLLTTEKGLKFRQPFSQIIAAGPVIRLRLGDLFRSNYSKFALARLFGVGDGDTVLDETTKKVLAFKNSEVFVNAIELRLKQPSKGDKVGLHHAAGRAVSSLLPGPVSPHAPTLNIDAEHLRFFDFIVEDVDVIARTVNVTPEISSDLKQRSYLVESGFLKKRYDNTNDPLRRVLDATYKVDIHNIKLSNTMLKKIVKERSTITQGDIGSINDFLKTTDESGNAIARSFKSVGGKGLAGTLDSLNFDWYDKITWATEPGSTAPKACKVTMTFTPIHDISPGLDHHGTNRAPIYPTGDIMGNNGRHEG